MLLRICLPSTWPIFSSEMRDGRRGLNLSTITLEINFYTTLHKAMGLKTSRVMEISYFGTRVMKEALRAFRTFLYFLEFSTTSRISCLIVSQQGMKKSTLNPSWPGAFPFCISLITPLTSSSDIGLLRLWLSYLVTSWGIYWVNFSMNMDLSSRGSSVILRKCCTRIDSISLWETSSIPWASLSFVILLCTLWAIMDLWKNVVFLSPSLIHCIFDFYRQNISSCQHHSSHSSCKESVSFHLSSVKPSMMFIWLISWRFCSNSLLALRYPQIPFYSIL